MTPARRCGLRLFFACQCLALMPLLRTLLRLRVRGPRLAAGRRGMIIAPNHQSWIDPLVVQYAVYPHRITFLMTELYYDLPLAGLYFRAAGARVVREAGPSVSGLRAARDALEAGEAICLFPEGELTRTGRVGDGRRGVARLARRTGVEVVPAGVRGAVHVFSRLQTHPRLHDVEVRLGAPMRYDEEETREGEERFTRRLMERIRALAES